MSKVIVIRPKKLHDTAHIFVTLANELGYPVTQAEQLLYILNNTGEVCIKESDDKGKILEMMAILDTSGVKYKLT